jgi:catechol 2,3-dioxygenase-like lactoylglutathione lyase family enzyme
MEIEQSRVVVKARNFDASNHFYEQTLAFPRLGNSDSEEGRKALFFAGGMAIEIQGRPRADESDRRDEAFDYQGPEHKMVVELMVPSATRVYEELIFRDRNIPGGLREDRDGTRVFETHDPDGVKIAFRERSA